MIVAARIYADVKGNLCPCGGKFSQRIPYQECPSFIIPKCNSCGSNPALFVIDADTIGINGKPGREKIRHSQNGDRLDSVFKTVFTINNIISEITNGTFDIRRYSSVEDRKALIFSNVASEYISHLERRLARGEITPKYIKDQKGLIKRELIPYFWTTEISSITSVKVSRFKDSYTSKERTRDVSLGALKTLLKYAKKNEYISEMPDFDPIGRAKKRKNIIPLDLAKRTVELMHKEMYRDMYTLMLTYPMRPCEVRALKWFNIDFDKNTITVDHHFSDENYLQGRKSIKQGEASSLTWKLNAETREILLRHKNQKVISLDWKNSFIFINRYGNHVSDETIRDAWVNARKKAGHTYQAYECRHRTATEIYKRLNGDIVKLKKVGGWTNITTPGDTYVRPDDNFDDLF